MCNLLAMITRPDDHVSHFQERKLVDEINRTSVKAALNANYLCNAINVNKPLKKCLRILALAIQ